MAEIVEVIHKINYEVDDRALQNVVVAIQAQTRELTNLTGALRTYRQQLNDVRTIRSFDELARKIEVLSRSIQSETGKSKGMLEQFITGAAKAFGGDASLEGAITAWLKSVGKHLLEMGTAGESSAISVASVGKQLLSFSSVAPAVISLVATLALKFWESGKAAKYSKEQIEEQNKKFGDFVTAHRDAIESEANHLDVGANAAKRRLDLLIAQGAPEKKILDARKNYNNELKKQYQIEIDAYDIIHDKALDLFDFYSETNPGFRIEAIRNMMVGELSKTIKETLKVSDEEADKEARLIATTYNTKESAIKDFVKHKRELNEKVKDLNNENDIADAEYNRNSITRYKESTRIYQEQLKEKQEAYKKYLEAINNEIKANKSVIPYSEVEETAKEIEEREKKIKAERDARKPNLNTGVISDDLSPKLSDADAEKLNQELLSRPEQQNVNTATQDAADDRRKRHVEELKEAYKTLAQAAVDTFNMIYEAQIKSLDKEIDLRKKRVEEATKLAEKGNTEQLALEQERLAKAEAEREKAAQKQLQLNALLQASNSALTLTEAIGAIVSAAAKGDPYTIALRVAAAVAALVTGIATVSAAFHKSSSQAFADGVVNYRGQGGPRDDANWVRISSGESIITAKGTAANRSILESINKGAEFRMLDGKLAAAVPIAYMGASGFASKSNVATLEKKLDGVIEAVRDNQFKQDVFFNENGVGLLTQRAVRRDRNRFK